MKLFLNEGIGPIKFGMTRNQLIKVFGTPDNFEKAKDEKYVDFEYNNGDIVVNFYSPYDYQIQKLHHIHFYQNELLYKGIQIIGKSQEYILNEVFAEISDWEIIDEEDFTFIEYNSAQNGLSLYFEEHVLSSIDLYFVHRKKESFLEKLKSILR